MRIAIVNDVLMAVEAMRRVVMSSGQHTVAWVAHDGASAVEYCAQDRPDLILMDLIMPLMDGVEATRRIMARTPCPIVIVTADVNQNYAKAFEAMGVGALDAVNTPVLTNPGAPDGANALLVKIETIRRLTGAPAKLAVAQSHPSAAHPASSAGSRLVAIGASAGGPAALVQILKQWPTDFPASIVIVQHVDLQFASSLANWLAAHTELHVRLARAGDHPHAGAVLLAGTEDHLVFGSPTRLVYSRQPAEVSFRPSVDVFFASLVEHWQGEAIGILLTGMGRDGADGLKLMREAGHHTIAQDEATSAVYGMPKAAAELHAAHEILPLDSIAPRVSMILAQKART
jgi:two-component system, chemotaxis family, response regulator WspF